MDTYTATKTVSNAETTYSLSFSGRNGWTVRVNTGDGSWVRLAWFLSRDSVIDFMKPRIGAGAARDAVEELMQRAADHPDVRRRWPL